jgi:hypothetical protein
MEWANNMAKQNRMISKFEISISKTGNEFTLRVPELHLIETGLDLETAYQNIETSKQNLIAAYERAEALDDLYVSQQASKSDVDRDNRLKIFAIKSSLVALAGVIIVSAAAFSFSYAIRETPRKAGLKLGQSAIKQVVRGLEDAAKKDLTPKKQEKIRILVSNAVPHLKPYIREFRPLLAELCLPAD